MARRLRTHYPGAIYHVIARGNNREAVFAHEEDKQKYISLIEKYKQKYHFSLYAYVLLDNHVHALISVGEDPLAKIMQGIQQSYTQYYNRKYDRSGHVFEQRYKAKLCKNDVYLLTLLRYIHRNPSKAGFSSYDRYKWSSHEYYKTSKKGIADSDFLLALFSNSKRAAIQKYIEFMEQNVRMDELDAIQGTYLDEDIDDIHGPGDADEKETPKLDFESLLQGVSLETGTEKQRILNGKYGRKVVKARDILIYLAIKTGAANKTELSRRLPISLVSVIKRYNHVDGDEMLKKRVDVIFDVIVKGKA